MKYKATISQHPSPNFHCQDYGEKLKNSDVEEALLLSPLVIEPFFPKNSPITQLAGIGIKMQLLGGLSDHR